tara:strand:- start:829 stop:1395 length:567 start_codon:yes stop_codon:yes gene_type:complete
MIKSKIAFFIFFVFISQGNIILANENIDCEEIRIDIDKPSYALTEEEKIQILDMELINTLNRFDECMENKNKSKQASSQENSSSASSSSSSSASRTSYGENSEPSDETENLNTTASINSQNMDGSSIQASNNQSSVSKGGSISQGDMESNDDDDIVAKQLREAAMAEADPEIKELLWERYRAYKGIDN